MAQDEKLVGRGDVSRETKMWRGSSASALNAADNHLRSSATAAAVTENEAHVVLRKESLWRCTTASHCDDCSPSAAN
ncbi:hypothetical protein Rhe02_40110 [Rhizocola hellebori]|uniref:Uncharacterized protein n=1 Tax=Rhizocola hellebori TaxID=1392758 RepID=A0A8J3Q9I9_9ACTN|nr:hypothetical protein Rhe02_40110 [Rhizocola hellebori]